MDRIKTAARYLEELYGAGLSQEAGPEFAAISERLVYGQIYPETTLDANMRELILLAVAAANQTPAELERHTTAAFRVGVPPEQIQEAVYQCTPYIGLAKAEEAAKTVNRTLAGLGVRLPLAGRATVTEDSRLLDGLAAQKAIFGEAIDQMRAAAPANQKPIQDYLTAYCFGDFYTREGLSLAQRELLTFAVLCALGGCEPQVKAHVGGNAAMGNGKETLLAALTVCMPFIGFPRTLNALACVNEILPEP